MMSPAVAAAIAHSSLNFGPLVLFAFVLLLMLASLIAQPNWLWSTFRWVFRGPELTATGP